MVKPKQKTSNVIKDIKSLLNVIDNIKNNNPDKTLFFRGQSKCFPNVTPSIDREDYLKSENILFREFILRNPDEFSDEKTTFEKLVKMQHYNLLRHINSKS